MAVCSRDPSHVYPGHNKTCPWCALATKGAASPQQVPLPIVQTATPARQTTPRAPAPRVATRLSHPVPRNASSQRTAATATSAGRPPRRSQRGDIGIIIGAVILCVTVLVPWLIGRHLLRDSLVRIREAGVFDVAARNDGDYFLSDWIAGCAVVLIVAGLILIRPRWSRRVFPVIAGATFGFCAVLVLLPQANASWAAAEEATVRRLATEAYPMSDVADVCGSTETTLTDAAGAEHLYQMYAVGGCSSIEVFDGWTRIGSYSLPGGQQFAGTDLFGGSSTDFDAFSSGAAESSGAVLHTTAGTSIGLTYLNPSGAWTVEGEAYVRDANLAVTAIGVGSTDGRLVGLSPTTGQQLWATGCPVPGQVMTSAAGKAWGGGMGFSCQGESGIGDTGFRNYEVDATGAIIS